MKRLDRLVLSLARCSVNVNLFGLDINDPILRYVMLGI